MRRCATVFAIVNALILVGAGVPGCAAARPASSADQLTAGAEATRAATDRLATRSEAELTQGTTPRSIDPPHDSAGARLLPSTDSERAGMDLADALSTLASAARLPQEGVEPAVATPRSRDQALQHFIKGRDAAAGNEYYRAILEFQRAQQLDPASIAILRELARGYMVMGNRSKSVDAYRAILQVDPSHVEARFAVGLSASDLRDFTTAAVAIGQPMQRGERFAFDPAASMIGIATVYRALEHLGFDRAAVELATDRLAGWQRPGQPSVYGTRLGSILRQRGEMYRSLGDAQCRLGRFEDALAAYREASRLRVSDPTSLHSRVVYANLRLGRDATAQVELLAGLRTSSQVTDRDIQLCQYLAENIDDHSMLAEAIAGLYADNPDASGFARAAAAVAEPGESTDILRRFIRRRPRDLNAVGELLRWLASSDLPGAVRLTIGLMDDHPDLAKSYAHRLALAAARPGQLTRTVRDTESSPSQAELHTRLLLNQSALGLAWRTLEQAAERWPDSPRIMVTQLEAAAALQEPSLVESIAARATSMEDVEVWLAMARVRQAIGQPARALAAARLAVALDDTRYDTLVMLGRTIIDEATTLPAGRAQRERAEEAAAYIRRAQTQEPTRDDAYDVLFQLYLPGGLLGDELVAREVATQLRESNPTSRLYRRLSAQESLASRPARDTIEDLLNLYQSDPTDASSLSMAISGWARMNELDAASRWLEEQLADRPSDRAVLNQWVRVQLIRDQAGRAIETLSARLDADDEDHFARHLLESAFRSAGRLDDAFPLGEQRLKSRPDGARRRIELAALYVGVGQRPEAIEHLQWVLDHADDATLDMWVTAVSVATRLEATEPADDLTIRLVESTIAHHDDVPLGVYASGMKAVARTRGMDAMFESLAAHAAREAAEAGDLTLRAALEWRELAQSLVDAGYPLAADQALRARIDAAPNIEPAALRLLVKMAQAAQAGADRPDLTIEMLRSLHRQSRLGRAFTGDREPTLPDVLFDASVVYAVVGHDDGARAILRETLRLNPDHPVAKNNLGYTRLDSGIVDDETIRLIEEAYAAQPLDDNILDTVGWLRYHQGRFEGTADDPGARELIERAIQVSAGSSPGAEVYSHLGDVHWRLGNGRLARQAWQAAVQLLDDPDWRDLVIQEYLLIQSGDWGLVVADPRGMYDQQFGRLLEHLQNKLQQLEAGDDPDVAPTLAESMTSE